MLVFLIAGEPSGDVLGGALMRALKERTGGAISFAGVGGERMAAEGLQSLVPLHELAVMGIAEVLPRARLILRRVRETAEAIVRLRPDAVVTIDSSGFTWRIAQALRRRGERLPLIHYVAPMVWAWGAGRVRRIARWYDHLMCLLPFEPPYFEQAGLPATWVGHPVLESGLDRGDGEGFRARQGIAPEAPLLTVLPGSRQTEVRRLLPVFGATVQRLAGRFPDLRVVVPTVANVADAVSGAVREWAVPAFVVEGVEKRDAYAASDAALAASGTVALELAMARLPAVVAYRVNPLTAFLAQRLVKVRYVNLVNLLLDREAVPELLLERCTPEALESAVAVLLADEAARAAQVGAYEEALARLGSEGARPSLRAADVVLDVIAQRRRA
ncbi:MAG: lipid-A-disaccharide synthase [Rhodospirillales bacterium]|nr:lipid-A-disaccharide synthase [Rhodospirillales bacterium]